MQDGASKGKAPSTAGSMRMRRLYPPSASEAAASQSRSTHVRKAATAGGETRHFGSSENAPLTRAHRQLFADRFITKQYRSECRSPPAHARPAGLSKKLQLAETAAGCSGCVQTLEVGWAADPLGLGGARQSSHPRSTEPRSTQAGLLQQTKSIFKFSPRQPLLAKRHSVRATPAGSSQQQRDTRGHPLKASEGAIPASTQAPVSLLHMMAGRRREPVRIPFAGRASPVFTFDPPSHRQADSQVHYDQRRKSPSRSSSGYASSSSSDTLSTTSTGKERRHASLLVKSTSDEGTSREWRDKESDKQWRASVDGLVLGARRRGKERGTDVTDKDGPLSYRWGSSVSDEKIRDALMGEGLSLEGDIANL